MKAQKIITIGIALAVLLQLNMLVNEVKADDMLKGGIDGTVYGIADSYYNYSYRLEGALVTVTTLDGQFVISDYSNSDGFFSFYPVDPGAYSVKVTKTGYDEINQNVEIKYNESININFNLPQNPGNGGWICGIVTNKNNEALKDTLITVSASSGEFVDSCYTDINGFYAILCNEPDIYQITASIDYYQTGQCLSALVTGDGIGATVDFILSQKYSGGWIYVTVTGTDNGDTFPLEDALISIPSIDGQIIYHGVTNPNGYYILCIESGTYQVTVNGPEGYSNGEHPNVTVVIGAGSEVDFNLVHGGGWIYGNVEIGKPMGEGSFVLLGPIENALVTVKTSSGEIVGSAYTDLEGYYEIKSLEAGTYDVEAKKEGYNTTVWSDILVFANLGNMLNIHLSTSNGSYYDEPTETYGWIYGNVLNGTLPIEGVLIYFNSPPGETFSTYTDSNGYYEIYNLSAGFYRLTATKDGYTKNIKEVVTVYSDQGTEFDFNFEGASITIPVGVNITSILIHEAITIGNVGSEINISEVESNIFQHNISLYNGVEIKNLDVRKDAISFIVSGNETGNGKTIVINIDGSVFGPSSQVLVKYDGESISMADDINDVLNPNDDGSNPEYLVVLGSNGAQLLVSVPHFSEHTIEFFVQQVAQYLVYAVVFAVVLVVIAAVVMFRKGKED